ncbi:hypothetical protein [Wolbachia endosymbiont of Armadillidium arcangelii]|uniref:hypothetical protein n=1 Tax=Wolbachia endosymbiont of Armadillidium arcangelii TaxID=3158571 RepID=UPI0032EC7CC3
MSAEEICTLYKKRCSIEIFFRFIKQELNAKHFLGYSKYNFGHVVYDSHCLCSINGIQETQRNQELQIYKESFYQRT